MEPYQRELFSSVADSLGLEVVHNREIHLLETRECFLEVVLNYRWLVDPMGLREDLPVLESHEP